MTVATPDDVALPDGADPENVDKWETDNVNGVTSRLVWSLPHPGLECDVRVVASQRTDGSFITDEPSEEPLVYIDGHDYTLEQAEALANALAASISLADTWITTGLGLCHECRGSNEVRMSTGKWSYSAPCPTCLPDEFDAAKVDSDHFIIGPYVAPTLEAK